MAGTWINTQPLDLKQEYPSATPLTWQLRKLRNRSHCTVLMINSLRRERDEPCTFASCNEFYKHANNDAQAAQKEGGSARVDIHTTKVCSTAA